MTLLNRIKGAATPVDKVPPGCKTASQWGAIWNLSHQQAGSLLRDGIKAGIIGVAKYRVRVGGVTRPTPHYFEKKPAQNTR